MTDPVLASPAVSTVDASGWIGEIAAGLIAAGLQTDVHDTQGHLDVSGIERRPGRPDSEVIVDEDGYAELHWWTGRDAAPADVTAAIIRALAATDPAALTTQRAQL